MSVCTFLASDYLLPEVDYFLYSFRDFRDYTDKLYGVYLEWDCTDEEANELLKYIKEGLKKDKSIELWHVWLGDYYEYEDSPVIHKKVRLIKELTVQDIKELASAEIFNHPDKYIPSRQSFYCLKITR